MKKVNISIMVMFFMLLLNTQMNSQNFSLNKANSTLTVSGTSNLHDWDIISNNFSGKLQISDITTAQIENLEVYINSESLKSGKNAMDKKTYKALKTDDYKSIKFKMVELKSNNKIDDSTFEIKLIAEITICEVTKLLPIDCLLTKKGHVVNITGSCTMKMSDFNIEPPTALLGAITTGDAISIKFNSAF
jgi:polyisoprenoid-binding protein YceI